MKRIIYFLLFTIMAGTGCKKDSSDPPQAVLTGTSWVLVYKQDKNTNAVTFFPDTEPNKISITFNSSSNVISFKGICNTGDGTYLFSSKSGDLTISNLISTKIACNNVEWESYTVQNLNNAYRYMIDENTLMIYSNGNYNLFFIKA